jgi:hypothetical protein
MKHFKLIYYSLIMLCAFSSNVNSKSLHFGDFENCCSKKHQSNWFYEKGKKSSYFLAALPGIIGNHFTSHHGSDNGLVVPGLYDDTLYASGDVYIDKKYFLEYMDLGIKFDQLGAVYFEPMLPDDFEMPDFSAWSYSEGVYFDTGFSMNYLITSKVEMSSPMLDFNVAGDIYVVDVSDFLNSGTEVPLPAAAFFYISALSSLVVRRFFSSFRSL